MTKKKIHLNKQTRKRAIVYAIYRGGRVNTRDIVLQFGVSANYARTLLEDVWSDGLIARVVHQYRSNAIAYEYLMTDEQRTNYFNAGLCSAGYVALNQCYAIKHANDKIQGLK